MLVRVHEEVGEMLMDEVGGRMQNLHLNERTGQARKHSAHWDPEFVQRA